MAPQISSVADPYLFRYSNDTQKQQKGFILFLFYYFILKHFILHCDYVLIQLVLLCCSTDGISAILLH